MLGKGLSAILTMPLQVGPTEAMVLNEREVGPQCSGDALGGWRATEEGILVHSSFYPHALYQEGLDLQLLLAYARRAHEVANVWVPLRSAMRIEPTEALRADA